MKVGDRVCFIHWVYGNPVFGVLKRYENGEVEVKVDDWTYGAGTQAHIFNDIPERELMLESVYNSPLRIALEEEYDA